MTRSALLILVLAALQATVLAQPAPGPADQPRVKVQATGQAPAGLPNSREAAVEDALRRCVEAGGGIELTSMSKSQDFVLVFDAISTRTAGFVERYTVLAENPNQDGLFTVRVEAIVKSGDISASAEAFKTLIKRKGRPRLIVVGGVDKRPFEPRLSTELESALVQHGLTVIDLGRLNENQRRDAERAARAELDPLKAAHIAAEAGADYLVVVGVEGTQMPARNAYGQTLFPIDATGMLKVVRADTAMLVAAEVVKDSMSASTPQRALEEVTTRVTQEAVRRAIRSIASHWLEDVDQRGGQQVEIVLSRFPADRLGDLIANLRKVDGVREVIVDATDSEGRSHLRVVTNSSAADVGFVLRRLDPGLLLKESSKYRLVVELPGMAQASRWDVRIVIIIGIGVVAMILGIAVITRFRRERSLGGRVA